MAVGIGRQIDQSELETIAGDPGRVLRADDFDDLKNQLYDIHEATCSKYFFEGRGKTFYKQLYVTFKVAHYLCLKFINVNVPALSKTCHKRAALNGDFVVGNLTHVFEHLKKNITLTYGEKSNHGSKYRFCRNTHETP